MAIIKEAHLEFIRAIDGNTWLFKVTYTVEFRNDELRTEFDEAARLREHDPSDDDLITAYPVPFRFTVNLNILERSMKIVVFRDQLNTEIGGEEIQGEVWLRRVGDEKVTQEVITPILKLDP
jgi:hypothetical protein